MNLTKFDNSHVAAWQQAADQTTITPASLGGPEFFATQIRSWERTYVFSSDGILIPVAKDNTTVFGIAKSEVYTGVSVNSLLGIREMDDHAWSVVAELPRNCVMNLDVPGEYFERDRAKWETLNFFPAGREVYHRVDLPTTFDEWFMRPEVERYNVRVGQRKGLTVTIGGRELLEPFYQVHLLSFSRWKDRNTATQPHSLERLQRLVEMPGSRAKIALVIHEDKAIAGAIFCHYQRTGGYLYGGLDYEHRNLKANNLLHAEIIRHLIENGISDYNLGTSLNLADLERFKESLGARRCESFTVCRHRYPKLKRLASRLTVAKS